jgi:hypothetical protein
MGLSDRAAGTLNVSSGKFPANARMSIVRLVAPGTFGTGCRGGCEVGF